MRQAFWSAVYVMALDAGDLRVASYALRRCAAGRVIHRSKIARKG